MPSCALSSDVSFEGAPSLILTPGGRLTLWGRSEGEQEFQTMVRVPVRARNAAPVSLRIEAGGESRPGWMLDNAGAVDAEWHRLGPIPVNAGESSIAIRTECGDGAWPAGAEPFHLAGLTVGGQPLDPEVVAAAAQEGRYDRTPGLSDLETAAPDLFTGFEQTGLSYFLTYIPWIYSRTFAWGAPVRQASDKALSGTYSCYFYEDLIGTSTLETKNLPIPANSGSATIGGWIYAGIGGLEIDVHAQVDGGADQRTAWIIKNEEVGTWAYRSFTVLLSPDASTFYGWIRLKSKTPLSANHFWLDNYLVDFAVAAPAPLEEAVFGDIGGNLYGLEALSGSQDWRYNAGAGMIGTAPAIADGIAYVGTTSGLLSAVDIASGDDKWSIYVAAGVQAAPAVSGQSLLVMADDGFLRCYARLDGGKQWELNVLNLAVGRRVNVSGIALNGDILCIATEEGIVAVDIVNRKVLWVKFENLDFPYPPEVGEGACFCGGSDGNFYALELTDGSTRWTFDSGTTLHSAPQLVGGVVLVGDDEGHLRGLDAATGTVVFTLSFADQAIRSFLFDAGSLYVVGNAVLGAMYCYALTGETWQWRFSWTAPLANGAQADPVVLSDQVIVTASDSHVYSFNRFTGRRLWSFSPTRVAFAGATVATGAPALDTSRCFDRCCWLGSHNAYANSADGWYYAQQSGSLINQLDSGVRMLMLDTWSCEIGGKPEVVYAHQGCEISKYLLPLTPYVRFEDSLAGVAAWLARNPSEIVTIILEQRVRSKTQLQNAISGSGIAPYIFWADRPNQGPSGTWNVATQGWPPLAWMIAANKRLVFFSDQCGPNRIDDGLPYTWTWCVENDYAGASMNGMCNPRAESKPIEEASIALFIQNYAVTFSYHNYQDFMDVNDAERILGFVDGCQGLRGRLPNFLAVDWQEFGNRGGPTRAVEEINARWARLP
jgi:outer membrane protein assembly factor BamB